MARGRTSKSKTVAFTANGLPNQIKILRDRTNSVYNYEADKAEKIIFACEKYITSYIFPGSFIYLKNSEGSKMIKAEDFSIDLVKEFYAEKEKTGDINSLF